MASRYHFIKAMIKQLRILIWGINHLDIKKFLFLIIEEKPNKRGIIIKVSIGFMISKNDEFNISS